MPIVPIQVAADVAPLLRAQWAASGPVFALINSNYYDGTAHSQVHEGRPISTPEHTS